MAVAVGCTVYITLTNSHNLSLYPQFVFLPPVYSLCYTFPWYFAFCCICICYILQKPLVIVLAESKSCNFQCIRAKLIHSNTHSTNLLAALSLHDVLLLAEANFKSPTYNIYCYMPAASSWNCIWIKCFAWHSERPVLEIAGIPSREVEDFWVPTGRFYRITCDVAAMLHRKGTLKLCSE